MWHALVVRYFEKKKYTPVHAKIRAESEWLQLFIWNDRRMLNRPLESCPKCRGLIAPIHSRIGCNNGPCGSVFHSQCAGLTEEQLKLLETTINLSWRCDGCLGSNQNQNQSSLQLSKWLEQSLRQHEKRLEVLEQRSKLNDPGQQVPAILCPYLPNTISRKAISITVAFVLLTTLLGIILATTTNLFGKTLNKPDFDVIDNGTLVMLKVAEWGGRPPKTILDPLELPVHRVIISHTAAEGCESREICSNRTQVVQDFHMDSWGWDHVGYNFLVGGDGRVYEGRGWDRVGAHTKGYNRGSIGISFIGTFTAIRPAQRQLKACQLLIDKGVQLKMLAPDFRLYGHRQLSATESPGEELYKIIQTWPHWSHEI
ncbi:peptidoglycan-recognition protein LC isoform X6 [Drosophila obscura]|uniref:peptidoglycan-recognition protein LC isoform X6 n=1 Tax=Drosophila obscura TaxID=7282 RepID=UPI001BB26781|nr:peptidoglycan-recognition protein LC isoform X6 [Drosophila obscura]